MRTRTVASGEVVLVVTEWGDPAQPTVILIHGYPDTSAVWLPVAQLLADRYHTVAYDVRGAGSSSAPGRTRDYRLELLVDDLGAVIDATCPRHPVHLVGHDWGSIQGWQAVTTAQVGARIASYTSVYAPGLDHARYWVGERLRRPTPGNVRQLLGQQVRSWYIMAFLIPGAALAWKTFLGESWPRILERLEKVAPSATHPAATVSADGARGISLYRANFGNSLGAARPRRTEVPVQVIVPTHDHFVSPALSQGLERWAPRLWRAEVDAGHWVIRTHPGLIARWIGELVDHTEGGPESQRLRRCRVGRS